MSAFYPYFEIPYPPCITNAPTPLAAFIDVDHGSSPTPGVSKYSKHFSYFFNTMVANIKDMSTPEGLQTVDSNVSIYYSASDKHLMYTVNSSSVNDTFKGGRIIGLTLDQINEERYPTKRKFLTTGAGKQPVSTGATAAPGTFASTSLFADSSNVGSGSAAVDDRRGSPTECLDPLSNPLSQPSLSAASSSFSSSSRVSSLPLSRPSVFVPSRPFSLGGSSAPSSSSSSSSSASASLLPSTWLPKHLTRLPSYIVVVTSFSADASPAEWSKSLERVTAAVEKLKACGAGRDAKVHLVVLKRGQGTAPWEAGGSATTTGQVAGGDVGPPPPPPPPFVTSPTILDPAAYRQVESDRLGLLRQKCGLSASLFTALSLSSQGGATTAAAATSDDYQNATASSSVSTTTAMTDALPSGATATLNKESKRLYASLKTGSATYYLNYARKFKKKNATLLESAGTAKPPMQIAGALGAGLAAATAGVALASLQSSGTGGNSNNNNNGNGNGNGVGWGAANVGSGADAASVLACGARFCFKVAIFYEMQQNKDKATRYYVESYAAVASLYRLVAANAVGPHVDLGHQCRGLGEWVHYKLYKSSLETAAMFFAASIRPPPLGQPAHVAAPAAALSQQQMADALLTAAEQWTRHSAIFLSSYWSEGSLRGVGSLLPSNPRFCFHSFVARQRLVAAILCERHAPRGGEGLEPSSRGSVDMFLCGHRHYAAVAEALLEVGRDLRKVVFAEGLGGGQQMQLFRCPNGSPPAPIHAWTAVPGVCVGGFPRGGLPQILSEEASRDHGVLALAYVDKALSLLDQGRAGRREPNSLLLASRLHFIKSGVHADREEWKLCVEAATRSLGISRTAVLAHGVTVNADASVNKGGGVGGLAPPVNNVDCSWPLIALQARARIMRACEALGDAGGVRLAALELLLLPSGGFLSGALLEKVMVASGWGVKEAAAAALPALPTSLPTFANSRDSPISFVVTFPGMTHAVAGDTVIARLSVRSNVSAKNLVLRVARIELRFGFATVGVVIDGGVLELVAKTEKVFDVAVPLPATLVGGRRASMTVVRDSPQKGAGADPALKAERPNSVGFTRAGGACFPMRVGEVSVGAHAVDDVGTEVFGGVPVSCRGITCTLADNGVVIVVEDRGGRGSGGNVEKDEDGTARIREDFVVHSWAGGGGATTAAGVIHGPRCLRVVPPTPKLEVTNLTSAATGGRGMDGVVHRVVFKVQAGAVEECRDLTLEISCANAFASAENQGIKKWHRPAIFVTSRAEEEEEEGGSASGTNGGGMCAGYNIPSPWKPLGADGMGARAPIKIKSLSPGEATYVAVHLFRACPNRPVVAGSKEFLGEADADSCFTEFECVFTYNQVIKGGAVKEVRRRHVASVAWGEPLGATLSLAALHPFPSGVGHRGNAAREREDNAGLFVPAGVDGMGAGELKPGVVSGEPVKVRCLIYSMLTQQQQQQQQNNSLGVVLKRVAFEEIGDNEGVEVKFEGGEGGSWSGAAAEGNGNGIVLYSGGESNNSNSTDQNNSRFSSLGADSKIGLSFVVVPKMKQPVATGGAKAIEAALGRFNVWWEPLPLLLGGNVTAFNETIQPGLHGPLPSASCGVLQFLGPAAVVEDAPFKVELVGGKSEVGVGLRYKLCYKITNKTALHQHLAIEVEDCSEKSFLVGGVKVGSFKMNPGEVRVMEYDVVFFVVGKRKMPTVSVVSLRHQSYVIGGGTASVVSLPHVVWVNPR